MWHNRAILSDALFVLNGDLKELTRLTSETEAFCRDRSLGPEVEFDLNLALEELFTNALRHGGCEGMQQAMEVRLQAAGDGVRVEFRDRGRPFDPTAAPAPDLSVIGGLGIHLVRGIMDDLEYQRAGEWNLITMRRSL
jgi:anti-sigma regulatory factor (Ser/Thr protein kinase)